MKFGVVVFPGSNCDKDMVHVLKNVMQAEVEEIWHKETQLEGFGPSDCIVLPGGFSYGDYLRTGAIARFSPIMDQVIDFANKGGKVLGICNGFQILCEAGLLPGALLHNNNQKFICKNVFLKVSNKESLITRGIEKDVIEIPIAHADGRYFIDDSGLESLKDNNQILFQYAVADGETTETNNPNGSVMNIAGICNREGNVFGMMPHPERAAEEALGNTDGRALFKSLIGLTQSV